MLPSRFDRRDKEVAFALQNFLLGVFLSLPRGGVHLACSVSK